MRTKSFLKAVAVFLLPLVFATTAVAAPLYWDTDGATPGAGGPSPNGTWSTGGTTWSTSPDGNVATGSVTTALTDDLFFSAGINATGAYTITLTDSQNANRLTFQEGTATISGNGGIINFGGSGSGIIRVNNSSVGVPTALTATIGNNTSTVIAGAVGLTKTGVGTLTLNGSQTHGFTGGLNVNGGTLNLNFTNLATPTDLIAPTNNLSISGSGRLLVTGNAAGTTSQTFGNVTVGSGGGAILGNRNGGTALNITLGSLTTTAKGGSLLVGAGGTAANIPVITTTTNTDASGIYGGRVVYFNGTANTGYDWAANTGGGPNYTLSAYSGYTAMAASGVDTNNSRITASHTLTGNLTTNSLKFESPATAQTLDLGGNTLTLSSGGLLFTGGAVGQGPRISNGSLTAGAGSNYDLVIHQYNATNIGGGSINNNTHIFAAITDNGANAVTLVKAGTGTLILSGSNTFTGGIVVNDGGTIGWRTNGTAVLNNNSLTFNANTIVLAGNPATTNGGITINNGSQIDFRNNTQTFTVNGAVTGEGGGITLGQDGGGATRLNFNSTANTFTGTIEYRVTPNAGQDGHLRVNSLADSEAYGSGNIRFGVAGTGTNSHIFTFGGTSGAPIAPLVLDNRRIELAGSHALPVLENNSAQAFTINSDLLSSGTGTKNFTLRGTGSGLSTFAGAITNGTITTLNIVKDQSGTWVLSGANTYNGNTTINGGNLTIGGSGSLGTTAPGVGDYAGTVSIASANSGRLVYNSTANQTFSGQVTGAGQLFVQNGVLNLTNSTNNRSGATTVSGGTLAVTGAGTINTSSSVTVSGGTLLYSSSTDLSAPLTWTSGTLAGTNWNGNLSGLVVGTGQTISPGNSPGTANTGSQTWAGGGSYLWEINDVLGGAGSDPGWDLLLGTGALDITATSGSPFTINITSLDLTNSAGNAANFDETADYSWLIAQFGTPVTGFDPDAFFLNTAGFSNPFSGTFGIALGNSNNIDGDDSQIYLTYTGFVIPEPSRALLFALGALGLLARRRR